jgi:hypothetical protein
MLIVEDMLIKSSLRGAAFSREVRGKPESFLNQGAGLPPATHLAAKGRSQ